VDLIGWTIGDDRTDAHTITESLVIAGGGYAVLARNGDATRNGGVQADYVYGDDLFLFNGTDQIGLVDPAGASAARVAYDGGATYPNPTGASMSLRDTALDGALGANWCRSTSMFGAGPEGRGDLGTPGAANDCDPPSARVVITEIMQNPDQVADAVGEWFEIHNPGAVDVDLAGWMIRDDDADFHAVAADAGLVVPAGGYVVLARNGAPGVNGGVTVDYVYGDEIVLHNTMDELVLADTASRLVDEIAYDDGVTFPDPHGASMSLRRPALDNTRGANWCESPVTSGPIDRSTPGVANDCTVPPPPPAMVITEVMQNPAATLDNYGEWIEIYNPDDEAVDINGWIVRDDDTNLHVIDNGGPLVVAPGDYAVIGRSADQARNGGIVPDYVASSEFVLFNTSDEVILTNPALVEVDRVAWDDGLTFPDPDGASMALGDLTADNAAGGTWCTSVTPFGAGPEGSGDRGTPAATNDCTAPGPAHRLVISEIMQNPFAAGETYGEWFEVYNPGDVDVDLNGWTIRDDDSDHHKIDAPDGLVVPAGGYAVLGRSLDEDRNGGAGVDYSFEGAMAIVNKADEIVLVDRLGLVVDRVAWDTAAGWWVRNGAAMELRDLDADNGIAASWCVAGPQFGGGPEGRGDLGTPGAANDCAPMAADPALVITEVMMNPHAVPDSAGEWFEVHNPTGHDVDLEGWVIRDNDFNRHVVDRSVVVPAGGYVVLARNSSPGQNGGATAAYAFGGDIVLMNQPDELELLDPSLRPVDRIAWDYGVEWPAPRAASFALEDLSWDNGAGSSWCASVTPYGQGDLGTPGTANVCVLPPPPPPSGPEVDLAIEFYEKYAPVSVGDRLRYEVIVHNVSRWKDAEGRFYVDMELPSGVEFAQDKSHHRWDCDVSAFPLVRCSFEDDDLRARKKTAKIVIEVIVGKDAVAKLVATAKLDTSASEFVDPNPDNDSMTLTSKVCPPKGKSTKPS
jgi:hypothetical protein